MDSREHWGKGPDTWIQDPGSVTHSFRVFTKSCAFDGLSAHLSK